MPSALKLRREYKPGAPLYARRRLVFSGVVVERDGLIPPRSATKLKRLWRSRQAGHEPRVFKMPAVIPATLAEMQVSPAPTVLPAASVQPETFAADVVIETPPAPAVVEAAFPGVVSGELGARAPFRKAPTETVRTPPKRTPPRK